MDSPAAELAKEFGIVETWEHGLKSLGYPPSWVDTPQELITLRKSLKGIEA